MGDADIAKAVGVSKATVYNVRSRYLALGVERVVQRKARKDKGIPEKVDGRVEAHLIALACSATPNEEPTWTLKMLVGKLVELELVGHAGLTTVTARCTSFGVLNMVEAKPS